MWFTPYVLMFGLAVASDNNLQQVTTSKNDANGQCSYTLTIPPAQCTNAADQKLSKRLDTLEALQQQHLRQQQLSLLETNRKLERYISEQSHRIKSLEDTLKEYGIQNKEYLDCAEFRLSGHTTSGVYNITLEHAHSPLSVWCDMEREDGGWTLFQRRQDGSVYFFRDWDAYKNGFGNIDGEYWLGNDNIYHLSNQKKYLLRIDMWDFSGNYYWVKYDDFFIENESNKYKLHIGLYKGNAGDSLTRHNNMAFSPRDRDNDVYSTSCSNLYKGAWWYEGCYYANLNGYITGLNTWALIPLIGIQLKRIIFLLKKPR